MTIEAIFDAINVPAALIVFGIYVYKLTVLAAKFTWVERIGMGLTGAGCMMIVGPITFKPSPFDDWALTLLLIGLATNSIGRMNRHWLNNRAAKRQAVRKYGVQR